MLLGGQTNNMSGEIVPGKAVFTAYTNKSWWAPVNPGGETFDLEHGVFSSCAVTLYDGKEVIVTGGAHSLNGTFR